MLSERYEITADQYAVACVELAKLDKLAEKLGTPRINIYVEKREWVAVPDQPDTMYERLKVLVTGDVPVLDGWQFIATLQHEDAGTIIRATPFATTAGIDTAQYRSVLPKCDHCGQRRRRNDTYVVQHQDTGKLMQVGSSCIKDFTRHSDPHAIMQYIEFLTCFRADLEEAYDPDGYPRGGYGSTQINLQRLLEHTFAIIEQHGWIGRTKARDEDLIATVERALDNIDKTFYPNRHNFARTDYPYPIEPKHVELALAAIQWVRAYAAENTVDQRSDYMHSLCVATTTDAISARSTGIAASLAYAYNRHLDDEQSRKVTLADDANVYVGTIGSKFRITDLTVTHVFMRDGQYGVSFTYIMQTPAGTCFKWQTAKPFDRGDVLAMNVVVKEHTEYKGRKQTVVTRCTKVEVQS